MVDHVSTTAVDELVAAHAEIVDVDLNDREAWLHARTFGIGGSDAGAILGVSPYTSPFQLAMEKTGQVKPRDLSDNEAVYWGNVLEPVVADEFARRMGVPVWSPGRMYRSKANPWQLANPDRFGVCPETGEPAIIELKTGGYFARQDWVDGDDLVIPAWYEAQNLHYAAVTGIRRLWFGALLGGQQFVIRKVELTEELIETITEAERVFWERYVIGGEIPPVDGMDSTTDAITAMWEADPKSVAVLGNDDLIALSGYLNARAGEKDVKEQKTFHANQIRASLQEASVGVVDGVEVVTWKAHDTTKTDWDRFHADNPGLLEKYQYKVPQRTLRVPKKAEQFIESETEKLTA